VRSVKRPVRIAQVFQGYSRAGAEQMVCALAAGLSNNPGYEVHVVATHRIDLGSHMPRSPRIHYHQVEASKRSRLRRFIDLASLLRRYRFDIVHTHMLSPGIYGRLAAWLVHVPIIIHTEHAAGSPNLADIPPFWAKGLSRITRCTVSFNDHLVAKLIEARLARPEATAVIPNGVPNPTAHAECDQKRASSREGLGLGSEAFLVLAAGRLRPEKDYSLGIRGFFRFLQISKSENAVLVIAGDGPERAALVRLVDELNMTEKVLFAGEVDDMTSLYRAADVFVNSSHWEGMPIAILEAMAHALPVVGPDIPALRALFTSGGGLLVPRTEDGLAAGLEALYASQGERRRLGSEASRAVSSVYSASSMIDSYQALYGRLLAEGRRRPDR
jgi:glycosyltransferase involved in cell wall biosynthesis